MNSIDLLNVPSAQTQVGQVTVSVDLATCCTLHAARYALRAARYMLHATHYAPHTLAFLLGSSHIRTQEVVAQPLYCSGGRYGHARGL